MVTILVPYKEVSYWLPVCLVLGREYDGVSPEVLELSDHIVHLPMYGMSNSINVATAASVLMYEALEVAMRKQARAFARPT